MLAFGVDGCSAGWVGIAIDERGFVTAAIAPTIAELADEMPDADGIGIDIPIGLLPEGFRRADLLARRQVGPRASSVFMTPPRAALEEEVYVDATALAVRLTGAGVSRQAHGLRGKILEVDRWLPDAGRPVWEVHPEVSFTVLAGGHLPRKKTWNGAAIGRRLLHDAGLALPDDLFDAGQAQVDDVLDASAVAWSCRRLLAGHGRSWPDPPQPGPDDEAIAIWA